MRAGRAADDEEAAAAQGFLTRALMPLHKPKCLAMYHQQLAYCVAQVGFMASRTDLTIPFSGFRVPVHRDICSFLYAVLGAQLLWACLSSADCCGYLWTIACLSNASCHIDSTDLERNHVSSIWPARFRARGCSGASVGSQFVEKEPGLAVGVVQALLRFWPLVNSQKEVRRMLWCPVFGRPGIIRFQVTTDRILQHPQAFRVHLLQNLKT